MRPRLFSWAIITFGGLGLHELLRNFVETYHVNNAYLIGWCIGTLGGLWLFDLMPHNRGKSHD